MGTSLNDLDAQLVRFNEKISEIASKFFISANMCKLIVDLGHLEEADFKLSVLAFNLRCVCKEICNGP